MRKLLNKTAIYLILIILLAGTVRIARAVQEERYAVDAYLYFQMAEDWAYYGTNYMMSFTQNNIPPLLPWIMAMGYNFGLTPEYTGLIIGILLGSLMSLAAFWITLNLLPDAKEENKNVLSRKHAYALLAAFFVAVHPFLVRISVSCLREILYLPLVVFSVAFAISAIYNKSLWKWCIFSALAALANMARREGIVIIFIPFAWQAVELLVDHKNFKKNIAYYILALVLVSVVFLGLTLPVLYILRDSSCAWSPFTIMEGIIFWN